MTDWNMSADKQTQREMFIDIARGVAMLFVLVSHFGITFFPDQLALVPTIIRNLTMLASPTFVIINGVLIGFLYRTRTKDFDRIRLRFTDRGIFLLAVAHLLVVGSHVAAYPIAFLHMTDTLGVCILIEPWLVTRIRPRNRVLLSAGLYVLSMMTLLWWHPENGLAIVLKETLIGSRMPSFYDYAFPVLPWFCLDFAATALGDRLGVHWIAGDSRAMQRTLARTAATCFSAGLLLTVGYVVGKHLRWLGSAGLFLALPVQKQPPSPAYLLCYGSVGLGLISACLLVERTGFAQRIVARASAFGQTSLFAFVLQSYVYYSGVALVRGYFPLAAQVWPVYLSMTVVFIVVTSLVWHRRGYNRFLTVGYHLLRAAQSRREAAYSRTRPEFECEPGATPLAAPAPIRRHA